MFVTTVVYSVQQLRMNKCYPLFDHNIICENSNILILSFNEYESHTDGLWSDRVRESTREEY